jgi:uncharacterized membrane protein YdfJ with MMPL/SSD domain
LPADKSTLRAALIASIVRVSVDPLEPDRPHVADVDVTGAKAGAVVTAWAKTGAVVTAGARTGAGATAAKALADIEAIAGGRIGTGLGDLLPTSHTA